MMRPALRKLVLWMIPLGYFLFVAGEFLAMTHIALYLTQQGRSAFLVGLMASAMWVGIFSATFVAHATVGRFGYARTFVGGNLLAMLMVASLGLHDDHRLWLLGAYLIGFAGGLVWVAGESWLAELAPADRRGFYVGMFETSVGLGMMIGPALLVLAKRIDLLPLDLAAAILLVAMLSSLPLLRAGSAVGSHQSTAAAPGAVPVAADWKAVALPLAVIGAVSGLMESGTSAILPSLALRVDFSVAAAALLGTVIGAGSAMMQTPIGALSDRLGMRRVLLLAWVVLFVINLAFLLLGPHHSGVLWPVGFILGGVGGSVYTLVVIELGHRLSGSGLVRAMSLLVTTYSGGTMIGPTLGGLAFDAGGLRLLALGLVGFSVIGFYLSQRIVVTSLPPKNGQRDRPPGP